MWSKPSATLEESGRKFPYRLHDLLSAVERDGTLDHIVSWQPHGRAFKIHDPKEFTSVILTRYYERDRAKTPKFSSFLRNLNLWGFVRLYKEMDKGCYYHEFFVRGHKSLCPNIQRKSVNGNKVRRKATDVDEPNFYARDRHQFCYFDDKNLDENGAKRTPIRLPSQYLTETVVSPSRLSIPPAIMSPVSSSSSLNKMNNSPVSTESKNILDSVYPFYPPGDHNTLSFNFEEQPISEVKCSNDITSNQDEQRDTTLSSPIRSSTTTAERNPCINDHLMVDIPFDDEIGPSTHAVQKYTLCTPIRLQATAPQQTEQRAEISVRSLSEEDTTDSSECMEDCFGPEEVKTLLHVLF